MEILLNKKRRRQLLTQKSDVLFIYLFTLLLMLFAGFMDTSFWSGSNLRNIFTIWIPLVIASYAQSFVIILGGIDLSIGSVISLAGVICASAMAEWGWGLPIVVALFAGAGVGLINGLIIAKAKQQPMIVTLATQTVFAGLALMIMSKPGGKVHAGMSRLLVSGLHKMLPVVLLVVLSVLFWLLLNRTTFGRNLFAVGGNENAALSTGIRAGRIKILTYVLSGTVAAFCGVMLCLIMRSGDPLAGEPYTMRTITAVVVGGTSFSGGKGGIAGTFAGVLILGVIGNMLNLIGVPSFYQYVAQGVILILALTISAINAGRQK